MNTIELLKTNHKVREKSIEESIGNEETGGRCLWKGAKGRWGSIQRKVGKAGQKSLEGGEEYGAAESRTGPERGLS